VTFSHEEANARLVDLVYGEAAPDARAALEAHVATCARCTADLAALGDTHARVRAALDDGAGPPVPSRARARILEAAAQAVAPATAAAPAKMTAAPARLAPPEPSFWEKLRGKWTLPTFATVGAIAVVVVASRVFLEPGKTVERGRAALAPESPPPPVAAERQAAPAANAPGPEGEAEPKLEKREEKKAAEEPRLDPGALGGVAADAISRSRTHAAGPRRYLDAAASPARLARAREADDGLAGLQGVGTSNSGGAPSGSLGLRGVGSVGAGSGAGAPSAPGSADRARVARKKEVADEDLAEAPRADKAPSASRAFASPPADWKGSAPVAAGRAQAPAAAPRPAAAPPPAAVAEEYAARDEERAAAPAKKKAAPEPASAAAAASVAKSAQPSALKDIAEKPKTGKQDEGGAAQSPSQLQSQEALARRADQLFAARRWSEAIAAYRELLRRFPDADLKSRWRTRITQAELEQDGGEAQAQRKARAKQAPAELEAAPAQQ